jgi:hypothetical protein
MVSARIDATDPETYAPAALDAQIRHCVERIAKGVFKTTERERVAEEARRVFDRAWAHAVLAAEGRNAEERKAHVILATMAEREAAELAEVEFRFAQRLARALEKELDGLRSCLVTSRMLWGEIGRGDP